MESKLTGRSQRWLAAGAIAAVAAVAGCGGTSAPAASGASPSASGGSAAAAAGQHVTIAGNNSLRFSPMTVHVHTGTIRITLKDLGAYPHNIVIPALGVTSKTVTGDPGSDEVTFTVTFTHPGHFPFHCQYHQSAGMVGVFDWSHDQHRCPVGGIRAGSGQVRAARRQAGSGRLRMRGVMPMLAGGCPRRQTAASVPLDITLIELIAARDPDALAALCTSGMAPPATGSPGRSRPTRTLAEDAVQEAFVGLWKAPGSYLHGRGSVRSWLLSLTHHKAVDLVRRETAEQRRQNAQAVQQARRPARRRGPGRGRLARDAGSRGPGRAA